MNLKQFKNKARLIRKSERYSVYDFPLQELVVSMTILHPRRETKGHEHQETEEVYFFVEGKGKIQVSRKKSRVKKGDIITIKKGLFHKVINPGFNDLIFLSVFKKYGARK